MAKDDVYRVQLAIRAEQISGADIEWDDVALHLKGMLNPKEIQIGNSRPRRFKLTAEIDTADDEVISS